MAEVDTNSVERARSAKPNRRAKSARQRNKNVDEVNKLKMNGESSVDSGTECAHQEEGLSSEDDLSPPRDPNQPMKRLDQTIPWKTERPSTSTHEQRQRIKSGASGKANNRPKSCYVPKQDTSDHAGYVEYLRPFSAVRPPLKRVLNIPDAFSNSYLLQHPNLSEGQKSYLWHTASVYSISNLKQLQQKRYEQMIQHQVNIVLKPVHGSSKRSKAPKSAKKRPQKHRCGYIQGLHNPKDCERYIKYLLGERRRQFEVDPRIWRNPPKIAPRGRYYHKRDKTIDYESWDEDNEEEKPNPKRPQTAVTSSRYGRLSTSKSRPHTATFGPRRPNTSKSRPQKAAATAENSKPKPEKRFPSGHENDKQLYYDTNDRKLKSPDEREKDKELKKKKEKKQKDKKKREKNAKKDEESEVTENSIQIEERNSRKNKASSKNSKFKKTKKNKKSENLKSEEKDTNQDHSDNDADDKAIKTVQKDNEIDDNISSSTETKSMEEKNTNIPESNVQIVVKEEANESDELANEEYDDIGEFNPAFDNRLKKQQQEDTISVYSSFSVDIPITQTQAPSELEY